METIRYLRALTRSWWLVLIAIVAGGVGGFIVYHQTTPLYASSVRVLVGLNEGNTDPVSGSALTEAVAANMAQVFTTAPAVGDVYRTANLGTVPIDGVTASNSGSFLTVRVSATSPGAAYRVAQAYADADRLKGVYQTIAGGSTRQYMLTVVTSPVPASDPYAPSTANDLGIGVGAGLVLGLVIALLRESLNRTVRDSDALRDLTGLTVYGTVPLDSKRKLMPARTDPRSARAEAYRQIRTSLLTRTTARPLVIGITSATLGEGKTSVSTNTAAIFSRAGHRVIVVDADLRRPRVHTFFGMQPGTGLSDVLVGRTSLEEAIVSLDDGNLGVLPAGPIPPDPAELIGSEAMVQVLHELVQTYEFVIVDTPPVLPVTDALVIGPLVDGLLFVTKLQATTDDRVVKALQAIERVNAAVLGVVPNQASIGGDRAYGYAYAYRPGRNERAQEQDRTSTPVPADPAMMEPLTDVPQGRRHQGPDGTRNESTWAAAPSVEAPPPVSSDEPPPLVPADADEVDAGQPAGQSSGPMDGRLDRTRNRRHGSQNRRRR